MCAVHGQDIHVDRISMHAKINKNEVENYIFQRARINLSDLKTIYLCGISRRQFKKNPVCGQPGKIHDKDGSSY